MIRSRFIRHFRCEHGHVMSTSGAELTRCQVWVGPARRREPCSGTVTETTRARRQGVRGG